MGADGLVVEQLVAESSMSIAADYKTFSLYAKESLNTNRYLPINSILLVKYEIGYSNTCFSTIKHAQNHGQTHFKKTLPVFVINMIF